jgi:hypothetical protein
MGKDDILDLLRPSLHASTQVVTRFAMSQPVRATQATFLDFWQIF